MTAKGLLATLIRAKDGDDVTVEGLCKTHTEGREVLTKAMRALVEDAFVVKFKIQREKSEVVELEDGTTETKRGGSWYTTFTVDSIPFTLGDVTAMLDEIYSGGNIKAVRVEPVHLDPRKALTRPTDGKPSVGTTCEEGKKPQVGPTDGEPTVGRPTVGRAAAHIRKKTSSSLSGAPADSGLEDEREKPAAQEENSGGRPQMDGDTGDVDKVMDAYIASYMNTAGLPPQPGAIQSVRTAASALLSVGRSVGNLCVLAAELGAKGWTDLVKHAQMNPEATIRPAGVSRPWCGECNNGREPMSAAQRMVETESGMAKCHCHPGYVPKQPSNA
ncbi:hypothetical protein ACL07V_37515 [Streptomyces sp. MB22_4]|uniref:hypothetical protein n=1 Tax=Streptomyces sp. MB22_4 TaxID=3383120 RepID=UPI0039A2C172